MFSVLDKPSTKKERRTSGRITKTPLNKKGIQKVNCKITYCVSFHFEDIVYVTSKRLERIINSTKPTEEKSPSPDKERKTLTPEKVSNSNSSLLNHGTLFIITDSLLGTLEKQKLYSRHSF